MTSVQRFIANNRNAVADATLTASAVKAARAVRQVSTTRAGNGRVLLAGDYIGHADTQIEIEVLAGGATEYATEPAFTGVGSGTLAVNAVAPGATAQTLTFTLADLGTDTTHAELALAGVRLRAVSAGSAGNAIRLTITPDQTLTATAYSLLSDWPTSQASQAGPQWDFGGLPLLASGDIDPATPRLRFGTSLDVYRPYREFKSGQWYHALSPALIQPLAAGTRVYTVSGGYDVVVADGVSSESYADVESFHDLLSELSASALVDVVGVAAADRRPGGIAAIDIPLRTTAWVQSQSGTALSEVTAGIAAPTEIVTVKCTNAEVQGRETWSVSGSVSGALGSAITGIGFTSDAISFTIPAPASVDIGSGSYFSKFTPVTRGESDPGYPSVCARNLRLGSNATPKTVTFVYEERPDVGSCACETAELTGRLRDACLGLSAGATDMALDPDYQSRLSALYAFRNDFVEGHASTGGAITDPFDQIYIDDLVTVLADTLALIYTESDALDEWDLAFTDAQTNAENWDAISVPESITSQSVVDAIIRGFSVRMDYVRALAGIVPKSESSTARGDGCWTDTGDTHWWVDPSGFYLPAFTNTAYISAAVSSDSGASAGIPAGDPYSTREFGLYIAVGCTERLLPGDSITITINTAATGSRIYSAGDTAEIHTIAAAPVYLSGGIDGTDTLTWSVRGSFDGPLDLYALTDAEPDYTDAGATVQIHRGGIPFALGDQFIVGIESGQFRWRRDGGSWSTAADIEPGALALADGLTAEFVQGTAPSFLAGDAWTFTARQPYAPANLQTPGIAAWAWSGTGANLVIDLGAETDITALALARYSLPAGATVLIEGGDGSTWPESQGMDVSGAVSVAMLSEAWSVSHLRLTVASATGGSIGWLWAGEPLATTYSAARCRMARAYAIQRGSAINPSAQFLGSGQSGEIAWGTDQANASPLLQSDLDDILAMLDHMQRHAEPMILMPHHLHPAESGLVRVDTDAIAPQDLFELRKTSTDHRLYSLALTLEPVLR